MDVFSSIIASSVLSIFVHSKFKHTISDYCHNMPYRNYVRFVPGKNNIIITEEGTIK